MLALCEFNTPHKLHRLLCVSRFDPPRKTAAFSARRTNGSTLQNHRTVQSDGLSEHSDVSLHCEEDEADDFGDAGFSLAEALSRVQLATPFTTTERHFNSHVGVLTQSARLHGSMVLESAPVGTSS